MKPGPNEKVRPPMTDAARELAERYTPMARRLAKRHGARHPEIADDIESDVMLCLCLSASELGPLVRKSFGGMARRRLDGAAADRVRSHYYTRSHSGSLTPRPGSVPIGPGAESDPNLWASDRHGADEADDFRALVDGLGDRERAVLEGVYLSGDSRKAVAARLGVSEARVCQIHGDAVDALRLRLGPVGWELSV